MEAGLNADRLSVNIEMPTREGLKLLAPEKNRKNFLKPIQKAQNDIAENRALKKQRATKQHFAPAGQSTQMIVGATGETDFIKKIGC
jgi:predicted DNA-binding helix-hairpin-helix protein